MISMICLTCIALVVLQQWLLCKCKTIIFEDVGFLIFFSSKNIRFTNKVQKSDAKSRNSCPNESHKSSRVWKILGHKTLNKNNSTKRSSKGPAALSTLAKPGKHFEPAGRDLGRGVWKETGLGTLFRYAVHLNDFGSILEGRQRVDCVILLGRFWVRTQNPRFLCRFRESNKYEKTFHALA